MLVRNGRGDPCELMSAGAYYWLLAIGCLANHGVAQVPEQLTGVQVIDFSNPAGMGYVQFGYRITAPGTDWVGLSSGGGIRASNGGQYLSISTSGAPVTLAHADGLPFELVAFDLGEYSTTAVPDHVDFEGLKADGSRVALRIVPDKVIDGSGPVADFEAVSFPAAWSDLVQVQVLDGKVALDNIVVRGLRLDGFHAADSHGVPLEVLGLLEESFSYNTWGVESLQGGELLLRRQRYSDDPVYYFSFDLASGSLDYRGGFSNDSGGNLATGEVAFVSGNALVWQSGHERAELAWIGRDGVSRIGLPRPSGGRVLFVNDWYQGHEEYAVFLAGPQGVAPVLTPETVLPDGGSPYYFPDELVFTGNSFAIQTSTTKSGWLYVMSFDGGPLVLSPGEGTAVPGTSLRLSGKPQLRWLNDDSAGLLAASSGGSGELLQIVMTADGAWTATVRPVPAWGARRAIPGAGFVQRHYSAAVFDRDPAVLCSGPLECADLAPNNIGGLVVETGAGQRHVMIRQGRRIEGFGVIDSLGSPALVDGGWFFATARNTAGAMALLRGRIPGEEPRVRAGAFVAMADGTLRLMVENLTHGRLYQVRTAADPGGPWITAGRFTAGSPARSVLADFERAGQRFFRIVEAE